MDGDRKIKDSSNIPLHPWRRKLHIVIFESDTYWGKMFDVVLLWVILLSLLVVILESEKSLTLPYEPIFGVFEWAFTLIFSIEWVARIVSSRRPSRYIFSFFGIVDLISILPSYLGLLFPGLHSLMVFRAFRLLRIFRIFKFGRYLKEGSILVQALKNSSAKITVFLMVVLTMVLVMGTVMHLIEGDEAGFSSIPRGMYWAVVTMTTVGYGDLVPVTGLGRFLAAVIMVMGYGIIAVPTGIVTSELTSAGTNSKPKTCPHCEKDLS